MHVLGSPRPHRRRHAEIVMLPGGSFIDDTALALLVDEYQDERVLS